MKGFEIRDYIGYDYDHMDIKKVDSISDARKQCKQLLINARPHIVDIDFHINY